MKDQLKLELTLKMAKLDGWTDSHIASSLQSGKRWVASQSNPYAIIPDYLNDLNPTQDVFKKLGIREQELTVAFLSFEFMATDEAGSCDWFECEVAKLLSLTPEQWVKAIIKAVE